MHYRFLLLAVCLSLAAETVIKGNQFINSSLINSIVDATSDHDEESIKERLLASGYFKSVLISKCDEELMIVVEEHNYVSEIKYESEVKLPAGITFETITGLISHNIIGPTSLSSGMKKLAVFFEMNFGKVVHIEHEVHDNGNITIHIYEKYTKGIIDIEFIGLNKMQKHKILMNFPDYNPILGMQLKIAAIDMYKQIIVAYAQTFGLKDCKIVDVKFVPVTAIGNCKAIITIDEGKQYYLENCFLKTSNMDAELVASLRKIIDEYMLKTKEDRLIQLEKLYTQIQNKLNEHADFYELQHQLTAVSANGMEVNLTVISSKICISEINIIGNNRIDKTQLLDILDLYPGKIVTNELLRKTSWHAKTILSFIGDIQITTRKLSHNLYALDIKVIEKGTFLFSPFNGGLTKREDASGYTSNSWNPFILVSEWWDRTKLEFKADAQWGNVFGSGKTFKVVLVAHGLSKMLNAGTYSIQFCVITPYLMRKNRIGDFFAFSWNRCDERYLGNDRTRILLDGENNSKVLFSNIRIHQWYVNYSITIHLNRININLALDAVTKVIRDHRIFSNKEEYYYPEVSADRIAADQAKLAKRRKNNPAAIIDDINPGKRVPDDLQAFTDMLKEHHAMPALNTRLYNAKGTFGFDWTQHFRSSNITYYPELKVSLYACRAGIMARYNRFHIIPGLHMSIILQYQRVFVTKAHALLQKMIYNKASADDRRDICNIMLQEDLIHSRACGYDMDIGPYNQVLDKLIGGKEHIGLTASWEYDIGSEYFRLFAGLQCVSVHGYDNEDILTSEHSALIRKYYGSSDTSNQMIASKAMRFRMAISFGLIVNIGLLGVYRLGVNLSVPFNGIFGDRIGLNKHFDYVSLWHIQRAAWHD